VRGGVTLGLAALRATGFGALVLLIWNPAAVRLGVGDAPRLVLLDASLSMTGHGGQWRAALDTARALAHGDEAEDCEVRLVVVTYRPGEGPRPATRRIDGVIVDLGVISAEQYLGHARTLSTSWPLAADQYLTTSPTYDPDSWYQLLRDTHLSRLAEAGAGEFTALAREAWYDAYSAQVRARQLATWHDLDAGLVALSTARVGAALVDGLLSRTYFRDAPEAVRRTGLAGAPMAELAERIAGLGEPRSRNVFLCGAGSGRAAQPE